jgi:hypothetical protein
VQKEVSNPPLNASTAFSFVIIFFVYDFLQSCCFFLDQDT